MGLLYTLEYSSIIYVHLKLGICRTILNVQDWICPGHILGGSSAEVTSYSIDETQSTRPHCSSSLELCAAGDGMMGQRQGWWLPVEVSHGLPLMVFPWEPADAYEDLKGHLRSGAWRGIEEATWRKPHGVENHNGRRLEPFMKLNETWVYSKGEHGRLASRWTKNQETVILCGGAKDLQWKILSLLIKQ